MVAQLPGGPGAPTDESSLRLSARLKATMKLGFRNPTCSSATKPSSLHQSPADRGARGNNVNRHPIATRIEYTIRIVLLYGYSNHRREHAHKRTRHPSQLGMNYHSFLVAALSYYLYGMKESESSSIKR